MKFGFFYFSAIILLFASCAQVVAPTGGPKDIAPPRVVKYEPDSASINFKSKTVSIVFNEYIQIKDISNQLIISPPLEKAPEVKVKGKTLKLEFESDLKENTTYTLNFGTSIRDITEDNAAIDL